MRAGDFVAIRKKKSQETVGVTSRCLEGKTESRWEYEYSSKNKSSIRGDKGEIAEAQNGFWDRNQRERGLLLGEHIQLVHDSPGINVEVSLGNNASRGLGTACSECKDKGVRANNDKSECMKEQAPCRSRHDKVPTELDQEQGQSLHR